MRSTIGLLHLHVKWLGTSDGHGYAPPKRRCKHAMPLVNMYATLAYVNLSLHLALHCHRCIACPPPLHVGRSNDAPMVWLSAGESPLFGIAMGGSLERSTW